MDERDTGTFERAFKRVSGAFGKGFRPGEFEPTMATYFRGLVDYPMATVEAAADECIRRLKRFPRVAEWIQAARTPGHPPVDPSVRQMSITEADEHFRAYQRCFQGDPCTCLLCQAAGVTDVPIRFVPTVTDDEDERAFNPRRGVVYIVGHWAHGEELRRWYQRRTEFRTVYQVYAPKVTRRAATRADRLLEALDKIPVTAAILTREPGEEG